MIKKVSGNIVYDIDEISFRGVLQLCCPECGYLMQKDFSQSPFINPSKDAENIVEIKCERCRSSYTIPVIFKNAIVTVHYDERYLNKTDEN